MRPPIDTGSGEVATAGPTGLDLSGARPRGNYARRRTTYSLIPAMGERMKSVSDKKVVGYPSDRHESGLHPCVGLAHMVQLGL